MPHLDIRHEFRAAHRETAAAAVGLLHGHTWSVLWVLSADDPKVLAGETVTAGAIALKSWIDCDLNHALMVSDGDDLVTPLSRDGQRVLQFGRHPFTIGLAVPDGDNVARMLHRAAQTLVLAGVSTPVRVTSTTVWDDRGGVGKYTP